MNTPHAGLFPFPTVTEFATRSIRPTPAPTAAFFVVEELPTSTPMPSPTPVLYHIRPGDTLLGIALAKGIELQELLALNPGIDPNTLQINQAITLPVVTMEPAGAGDQSGAAADLEIENAAFYEDRSGSFWFMGEVMNRSDLDKTGIEIELTLFDEEGREELTIQIRPVADLLLADGKIPFGWLISDLGARPAGWKASVIQATVFNDTEAIYWRLSPDIGEVTIDDRLVKIKGQLTSTGNFEDESISVIATAYTAEGKIAGFRNQSITNSLAEGAVMPFSIEVLCAVEPTEEVSILAVASSTGEP